MALFGVGGLRAPLRVAAKPSMQVTIRPIRFVGRIAASEVTVSNVIEGDQWRRCSSCKKQLPFSCDYWVCNVSTCNRRNSAFVFCTVSCWDAHLGIVRHRESWAVEAKAPTRAEHARELAKASEAKAVLRTPSPSSLSSGAAEPSTPKTQKPAARRVIRRTKEGVEVGGAGSANADLPKDTLVVMSKLKLYVSTKSGFSTSGRVAAPLSDAIRDLCDEAIENAQIAGRKTVQGQDVEG
ncbi:MAG: hypothetical protein ACI8W3_000920 [Myxococcota bacterium]|jgi:hypothetical protein